MNIAQAKKIELSTYLQGIGCTPARRKQNEIWYLSPFRRESTASFKVNIDRNSWYDFGEGCGGDIIDLVKRVEQVQTTADALEKLRGFEPGRLIAPIADIPRERPSKPLELSDVRPLTSRALLAYAQSRGIKAATARRFLNQVHYKVDSRDYFALGIENASGGYELRNAKFKGTLGSKDFSVVPGDGKVLSIFEGMFDFLTAYDQGLIQDGQPVIILNSVALREKALPLIQGLKPETIHLYRDNDPAGEQLLQYFNIHLPETAVIDMSVYYPAHRDFNEWLFSSRGQNATRTR